MRIGIGVAVLALAAVLGGAEAGEQREAAERPPVGVAQLSRLDLLPRLKEPVKVGMFSSYDRTGGNDDGFSGRHSFLRKEGDGLVIAEMKGPGCVTRIWTPTPTDDPVEFYFDGEAQPRLRIPFRKLFDGTQPPFVEPVSGYGAGGFWTYLPLPYRESLKVVVRAPKLQFYQLNYATYAPGTPVETFRPQLTGDQQAALKRAQQVLGSTGKDLTEYVAPAGAAVHTTRVNASLAPGKSVQLFSARKGGRVLGLKISPASALAGKDRSVLLRMHWDGEEQPAVLAPAGDFFGYSWGEPAARGLLLGTDGDTSYVWYPMPFDRSARIELVSERASGSPVEIQAEVIHADTPRRADEGRFYALWRRENPTRQGVPFTFLDTRGRGHVAGVALQAQGPVSGHTYFFEGDEQVMLDGELVAHGTGSEDFFNGGWYDVPGRWDARYSFPLSGCLDYKKHLGRTGAYRSFLLDTYSFTDFAQLTIEHAPERNEMVTDYAGVTYLYLMQPPRGVGYVPPVEQRAVQDFDRFVYVPGWSVPIHAFSFQNATLAKKNERIGNEEVRYLALRAEGDDVFGQHLVALTCEVPVRGRYRVSIETIRGPEQGHVQLFQNEKAMGEVVDLYSPQRSRSGMQPLGTVELEEGGNPIYLKLVGKNAAARSMGLDLITVQLERVTP
ncbi:MAG: glycoside hydrolase family 172 protein [Armatimonadota bacterium]